MKATEAQVQALRWLVSHGQTEKIRSSALMGLYEDRYVADLDNHWRGAVRINQNRRHAWRRTSGRVMNLMLERGLLERDYVYDSHNHLELHFKVSPQGFEVAK